uniref:RNase H type-1 domain-containing protein n=1 Tax=Lactuca sativa TaxID=4236 RepID=A0A9R1WWL5_LACSA|nr:hypothetical protein LSAT_V11C800398880 [Lactuca sativa]
MASVLVFLTKGNPGPTGAGAMLRAIDGSLVYCLREGLGVATNNAAEYRVVILGLRYALERGFRHIRVQGDSKLVCMQVYFFFLFYFCFSKSYTTAN